MRKHIHLSKYAAPASFSLLMTVVLLLLAACSIIPSTSTSTPVTPTTIVSTPTTTTPSKVTPTPTKTTKHKNGTSITITDDGFTPATLTIKVGTTITWTNTGVVDHNVTSTNGATLKSGRMTTGKTFSFKFTKAGTFNYDCTFHASFMIGKIIVK